MAWRQKWNIKKTGATLEINLGVADIEYILI